MWSPEQAGTPKAKGSSQNKGLSVSRAEGRAGGREADRGYVSTSDSGQASRRLVRGRCGLAKRSGFC